MLLLSLYCAPLTSRTVTVLVSLPSSFLALFLAWFIDVLQLRELAIFSQSSFLFFWARILNYALFFSTGWCVAGDWFSWIFCRIVVVLSRRNFFLLPSLMSIVDELPQGAPQMLICVHIGNTGTSSLQNAVFVCDVNGVQWVISRMLIMRAYLVFLYI